MINFILSFLNFHLFILVFYFGIVLIKDFRSAKNFLFGILILYYSLNSFFTFLFYFEVFDEQLNKFILFLSFVIYFSGPGGFVIASNYVFQGRYFFEKLILNLILLLYFLIEIILLLLFLYSSESDQIYILILFDVLIIAALLLVNNQFIDIYKHVEGNVKKLLKELIVGVFLVVLAFIITFFVSISTFTAPSFNIGTLFSMVGLILLIHAISNHNIYDIFHSYQETKPHEPVLILLTNSDGIFYFSNNLDNKFTVHPSFITSFLYISQSIGKISFVGKSDEEENIEFIRYKNYRIKMLNKEDFIIYYLFKGKIPTDYRLINQLDKFVSNNTEIRNDIKNSEFYNIKNRDQILKDALDIE